MQISSASAAYNCSIGRNSTKDPVECCPIPQMIEKTIFEKCTQANPDKETDLPTDKGLCLSECVLNTTSIYVKRAIVKETARKVLTVKDSAWNGVMKTALEKCLTEGI